MLCRVSGYSVTAFAAPVPGFVADFSNGVSTVQDGLRRFMRQLPENVLPPLLVTALTTPPLKRPYSAEMPEVSTVVSSMASSMNRFCGCANRLSLTSTPLTMNTLSQAKAPLMTIWPALGDRSVTFGASVAMPWMVRGVASASTSSLRMLALTVGDAIAAGVSATTCTASVSAPVGSVTFCSTCNPTATDVVCLTVVKPVSSNVTSYWPAGNAASV